MVASGPHSAAATPELVAPAGSGGGSDTVEELERAEPGGPRWGPACTRLAASAHRLQSGSLARCVDALLAAAGRMPDGEAGAEPRAALRTAAEAILGCLTPQIGTLGAPVVAEALRLMAAAQVEEQTFLDMLLARLLVTIKHDHAGFSPQLLAVIAGALGTLHVQGMSAKRAASGASSAANRRCVEALGEAVMKALPDFGGHEVARTGGHFLVAFLDDGQRRLFLARAADLQVGFAGDVGLLPAMQDMELAIRRHSFAFIASLADATKDYLMRLKVATHQAAAK